jgi:tetratricopeptide (TPR) repeat protein
MKKLLLTAFIFTALFVPALSAVELSLRPGGFVFIPLGEPAKTRYGLGGGGGLLFDVDLSSVWPNPLGAGYTAGIEGGMNYAPLSSGAGGSLSLYSAGAGLSLYYYPLSRLLVRLEGFGGVYAGVIENSRTPAMGWWRLGGGLGFRFTPNFVISANAGWRYYHDKGSVLHSGLYAGLTAQLNFETRTTGDVEISLRQDEGVFPAFLSLYQTNGIGTLRIRNNENAEIRNVRVSFRSENYTSSEFSCGTVSLIAKGRSAELPLYADFSPEVLNFTGRGRILGDVIVRYSFLGGERQVIRAVPVQLHNRNTLMTDDPLPLAAFVSPTSPETLEYAKFITGLARNNLRVELSQKMQFGVWLFEGLRAGGIRSNNKNSAAGAYGGGERNSKLFEIQFPVETLGYRSGNAIDVGLLFAGALEASGIRAAMIPLENDFIIAFSPGVNRSHAETLFNGTDKILIIDDEVWLPLSMAAFNEGFTAAWNKGAEKLSAVFAAGTQADCIILDNAWVSYPPAPLPSQGIQFRAAGASGYTGLLRANVDAALSEYIASEINPLIQRARGSSAGSRSADQNRLGILLIRAGRAAEAKAAYERAAGMGSVPAMTNRGNAALMEGDLEAAEQWFSRALTIQPDNAAAKRGMEEARSAR